jgi:hypothetical protein
MGALGEYYGKTHSGVDEGYMTRTRSWEKVQVHVDTLGDAQGADT